MIALTGSQIRADLLAFAIMSNHLHLIIQGTVTTAQMLFDSLLRKTARYYSARDNAKEIASVTCGYTEITSLRQFENEVVYVIRNPFVVNDSVHLFAYPWCSGYLYFNPLPDMINSTPAHSVSYRDRRLYFKASKVEVPAYFRFLDGHVLPESFVNIRLVEKLFGNARNFLFCALKNVEAQAELALSYKENPHLSDDELFLQSRQICRDKYRSDSPQNLNDFQKKELAILLRNRYAASNKQISRLCGLPLSITNELFPLSSPS